MANHFSKALLEWNKTNDREMPWKGEKNAYYIWLSEIILQQTRVEQGWKYYEKFILHYPTIQDLAAASEDEVLKDWEGLGYYSRARNLHFTAKQIVEKHQALFPTDYHEILALKGIGNYTAAAIASFAYDQPYAVVDGNVIRVLSRYIGSEIAFDTTIGKKYFEATAQEFLDKKNPATYNQAIMDFGATVCKPIAPLCEDCPFQLKCIAYNQQLIDILPYRSKKLVSKNRYFTYVVLLHKENVLIRKRSENDIWKGLHDFFLIEDKQLLTEKSLLKALQKNKIDTSELNVAKASFFDHQQQLTHQKIFARFFVVPIRQLPVLEHYFPVNLKKIGIFAFPKLINYFFEKDFVSFK
jgi:A/G-specific adenine glycosylase